MRLPLSIAKKLLLLENGEKIPASRLRHPIIQDLIAEGILYRPGRIKSVIQILDKEQLHLFLQTHFGINDLHSYINAQEKKEDLTRAELVAVAADSKLRSVRTFKGFLVNCYAPVEATLNNESITVNPREGTFTFIYDFEKFIPARDIIIAGVENSENFRYINRQKYLFRNQRMLFVSRYPQNQSRDLIRWLQTIPNNYLHFGDFDFAGIGIYVNEFKKYLGDKANFFIPDNIDSLIRNSGSKKRYDEQKINFDINAIIEENVLKLVACIHKHKKGLDQEVFINKMESSEETTLRDKV